jgi:hypothetical protein
MDEWFIDSRMRMVKLDVRSAGTSTDSKSERLPVGLSLGSRMLRRFVFSLWLF